MNPDQTQDRIPARFYLLGFVLCVLLTLAAYYVVDLSLFSRQKRIIVIGVLAAVQAFVQLFFFLHFGREPKPKWQTFAFFSMLSVLTVLVVGSLWIMYNLDYRMTGL